ncbi:substrate-binding domain-containing protein [Kineothrix sedimenti]|uniref:Substrate-binding domain-containing protein n=1 Tax=Kineothrix sedimenti TaxID=3123317 RepID=A0ABZ3EY65_9FIRM
MSRSRKMKLFIVFCTGILITIGILIIVLFRNPTFGAGNRDSDGQKHYVAVIAKSTTSAFWKSVFAGAKAASTEYNLEITCDGPESEEDYETQNAMVEKAVADGAEVIVFSAVDFNANAAAIDWAIAQGVNVVVIDSEVNSSGVSCVISTDNYAAGRMAGEAALESDDKALYVGIVNFDENSANGQQREQGFRDAIMGESRVTVIDSINVLSNVEDAMEGTRIMLEQHPQIDVIATFNEWTSLGVGYTIEEMGLGDSTKVIAFDSNVVSVGLLETGEVDALIVQNPYAMGYLGIENAYNVINDIFIREKVIDTATTIVTKENMYDPDYQKILFSFD